MHPQAVSTGELSSLPLQVVVYFSGWYLLLFYPALLAALLYKAFRETPQYPAGSLAAEVLLLFILSLLDANRIFYSAKGNLTTRRLPLLTSLLLSVPSLCGYLYLTLWQTYVLTVEVVLLAIGLAGLGLSVLLGLATLFAFQRAASV
jgi:hypothetical protein